MSKWILSAVLPLALQALARAQSPVLVVDVAHPPPSPGVDFAQIADAVQAAAGGEILLVHPGAYMPFTVNGKSLVVVADGAVNVTGGVTIEGLAADQSVVLRGLQSQGNSLQPGLLVDGCAGPVWVEDCAPTGGHGGYTPDGLRSMSSLALTLVRCTIKGGNGIPGGQFSSSSGGPGLRVRTSLVAAWEVTSVGGDGGAEADNGGSGGAGVLLWQGAHLTSAAGLYQGGTAPGGDSHFDFICGCEVCYIGGVGGPGLYATAEAGSTCSGDLRGVALVGGKGVFGPSFFCIGSDGQALIDLNHQVTQSPAPLRSLQLDPLAGEGGSLAVSLVGEAGDGVLVLAGFAPAFTQLSYGILDIVPQVVAIFGTLPASGMLDLTVPIPELGPGVEGVLLVAQPLFVPTGGGKVLGSPSATVLLDGQF